MNNTDLMAYRVQKPYPRQVWKTESVEDWKYQITK